MTLAARHLLATITPADAMTETAVIIGGVLVDGTIDDDSRKVGYPFERTKRAPWAVEIREFRAAPGAFVASLTARAGVPQTKRLALLDTATGSRVVVQVRLDGYLTSRKILQRLHRRLAG